MDIPPPVSYSPEIHLLGPQTGKAVTPLDLGRFQSRIFHSGLEETKPNENKDNPIQAQETGRRDQLKKEPSLKLDTPSRFLDRVTTKPSFNVKVRRTNNTHRLFLVNLSIKYIFYCFFSGWAGSFGHPWWKVHTRRKTRDSPH